MNLVTWNPEESIDKFFDTDGFFNTKPSRWRAEAETFLPKVNVNENENSFHLEAETPGMEDKDISVEIHNSVLTIKGRKEDKTEKEKENYRIREFSNQSFERSFRLSDRVDAEKVSAKIHNGILQVDLPKHDLAKPRKIEVKGVS